MTLTVKTPMTARVKQVWSTLQDLKAEAERRMEEAPDETECKEQWSSGVKSLQYAMDNLEEAEAAVFLGEVLG